jgi:hypothetical protein
VPDSVEAELEDVCNSGLKLKHRRGTAMIGVSFCRLYRYVFRIQAERSGCRIGAQGTAGRTEQPENRLEYLGTEYGNERLGIRKKLQVIR